MVFTLQTFCISAVLLSSKRICWTSSSMRICTNPQGNWFSRWYVFMILPSITFTWWLRSKPLMNGNYMLWTQEINPSPNITNLTKNAIHKFGWEILTHTLYSLGITSLEYHLFQPLPTVCKAFCSTMKRTSICGLMNSLIHGLTSWWNSGKKLKNEGEYIDWFVKIFDEK